MWGISMRGCSCRVGSSKSDSETECSVQMCIENTYGGNSCGREQKETGADRGDVYLCCSLNWHPPTTTLELNSLSRFVLHWVTMAGSPHATLHDVSCPWKGRTLEKASLHNWGNFWSCPLIARPPTGATSRGHISTSTWITYGTIFTQLKKYC